MAKQQKSNFAIKLMQLGATRGWTAVEMAQELGCSASYLSQIKSGKSVTSPKFLRQCVKVFELSQAQAFELFTLAYEKRNSFTLDLKEIDERGVLKKVSLSKLIFALTVNEDVCNPSGIGFIAAPPHIQIEALKRAIDALWDAIHGKLEL